MRVNRNLFKFILVGLLGWATQSWTETASSTFIYQKVERYLNQLKTVQATFRQVNAQGIKSTGRFYLWRPGLMRLDYDPPSQELIIADGTYITHIQKDLNEVSSLAIDSTPAAILLGNAIDFKRDIDVMSVAHRGGRVSLTLKRRDESHEGELTLIFNEDPLMLLEWIIKDPDGRRTYVALDNIVTGVKFPLSLFTLPEGY